MAERPAMEEIVANPLTFTTATWIIRTDYRGRESEYEVDVEYKVTPAQSYRDGPDEPANVEVINVTHWDRDFDCSDDEWERCYDAACEDAPSALADWFGDRDDYVSARAADSYVPAGVK